MDSSAAIAILRTHRDPLERRGVLHAAVFGSVARGEAHAAGDLDVRIDIDETTIRDVYDYVGVIGFITDLFPVAVDMAERAMMKPHVRPGTERDAIHAF
ncbi:nucleotidyltransferase [Methylobacterium sp. BTF04]|uniref:nucleotidyltransferase family protein n=1 Tax=Methylobacterium sp. BTF04 TaxID=2708300 RepID=UPI0013D1AB74|nr:nucleotidyltransferase domain-containing protein [Methylobacterium sp. BTF04]NEU14125.1 nucleotidyltransferase [Methylobacterium sp. BTF04]